MPRGSLRRVARASSRLAEPEVLRARARAHRRKRARCCRGSRMDARLSLSLARARYAACIVPELSGPFPISALSASAHVAGHRPGCARPRALLARHALGEALAALQCALNRPSSRRAAEVSHPSSPGWSAAAAVNRRAQLATRVARHTLIALAHRGGRKTREPSCAALEVARRPPPSSHVLGAIGHRVRIAAAAAARL